MGIIYVRQVANDRKKRYEDLILLADDSEFEAECRADMRKIDEAVRKCENGDIEADAALDIIDNVWRDQ